MIIVTGTKRSGTSLWMHLLVAAGLPHIGERFPAGWGELLRDANPDGFFESELVAGINWRTNPHPLTGSYLAPATTREHAVKVFIPGLVRSDVAFIDRCIATVRSWRDYVMSTRRLAALERDKGTRRDESSTLPPALEWWCSNYALIRDLAIRGYPVHVVGYDALLRDPGRVVSETLAWIGTGDPEHATQLVRTGSRSDTRRPSDADLADGLAPAHLEVFDELYHAIDSERPLSAAFVDRLNRTDADLRRAVLEHQASIEGETIADLLGRGARV
ncbi:MAG TPA: hypothetical protein VG755_06665 [Nannocystaceae bacterium]|nr:hypothetical protein [Nannocystaceae bacterium]